MTGAGDLTFHDVHKAYGAVHALAGVSFSIAEGETHAIVGENGAGKSTLLKMLGGITSPDRGEIRWHGRRIRFDGPRDALNAGFGLVCQEKLAFPDLTVSANIFAGRELTSRLGWLDESAMRRRTDELLARLHVPVRPDALMSTLPAAYCQLVQVARALAFDCQVLILDEPTTALTDAECDHLFVVLGDLKRRGVTIIFVSHRIPEVFRLCDRITVLRDGTFVETFARATATPSAVVSAMVGREPAPRSHAERPATDGPAALSVQGLTRRGKFRDISFTLAPGEIVGLFGLVGAGRTELLETLFGLARADAGSVALGGVAVSLGSSGEAARAGLSLVPEERHVQGLCFNLSVGGNLALPRAAKLALRRVDAADEARVAAEQIGALAIRTPDAERPPDSLSGGNQQKVVVGKWLATSPKVLLLDEPTKGVDVGAKFEIHEIVRREAARGMACLMASSDLPEVLALADRILVMRDGRIRGEFAGAGATEEAVMRLAAHEELPA